MIGNVIKELKAASDDWFLNSVNCFIISNLFVKCFVCLRYATWFDILLYNAIFVWPNSFLNTKYGFEVDQVLNAVLSKQTRVCFVEKRKIAALYFSHSLIQTLIWHKFSKQRPFNYDWQTAKQTEHSPQTYIISSNLNAHPQQKIKLIFTVSLPWINFDILSMRNDNRYSHVSSSPGSANVRCGRRTRNT